MSVDYLIDLLNNNFTIPSIKVPMLKIRGSSLSPVIFDFMGYADKRVYEGKRIYLSKRVLDCDCMESLLNGSSCFGESSLGKEIESYLDKGVFETTGEHLKTCQRYYDGAFHSEKVFLPLESEVFEDFFYTDDTKIKYKCWDTLKLSENRKKSFNWQSRNKDWLCANKSDKDSYCSVSWDGRATSHLKDYCGVGIAIAFCI